MKKDFPVADHAGWNSGTGHVQGTIRQRISIDAGLNAYPSLLGLLEADLAEFAGHIALILRLNSHDLLHLGMAGIQWGLLSACARDSSTHKVRNGATAFKGGRDVW